LRMQSVGLRLFTCPVRNLNTAWAELSRLTPDVRNNTKYCKD